MRKTPASYSKWIRNTLQEQLIIDYHKSAIDKLSKMTEWNLKQFQQELLKINEEIITWEK